MPSTTALFTGLSGLSTNASRLDVIGNNIANVNTTGYKSNRMTFATAFNRTLGLGTSPNGTNGGTNPQQVGLGVNIAGTQRNLNNGAVTATGVSTDVAIEGDGYFIVEFGGEQVYSRDGTFQLDEEQRLVSVSGGKVLGYGVDAQFNVVSGALSELKFPVGTLVVAEATRNVEFRGNLNASGPISTTGSTHTARAYFTDAGLTTPLSTAAYDLSTVGNDLYISDGAGGSFLAFEGGAGAIVTVDGVEKGGKDLGSKSFVFSATPVTGIDDNGTTVQDLMTFLDRYLGLDNSVINGQQLGGGVALDTATGVITITGNEGTAAQMAIESADIVVTNNGAGINQPMIMSKTGDAIGESVTTSFVVYDSLGSPITVDLTFALQQTVDGEGTIWTFTAESNDHAAVDRLIGLGTVVFDGNGDFVSTSNDAFSVSRDNGAVTPLTISMAFNNPPNNITSLTTTASSLAAVFQDGSPVGTLTSFAITQDGTVTGSFTNGLNRDLGQIALAQFANARGLVDIGNNNFRIGPNSGAALLTRPLEFGTGRLLGGSLELSNVDLSQEFIKMILTSTGYSASGRVITTTDELIDQLLILGR